MTPGYIFGLSLMIALCSVTVASKDPDVQDAGAGAALVIGLLMLMLNAVI